VIFLMAATVRAQDQVPAVASTEERMADRKRVEVFRYYTELRRGTTEDVAVLLLLKSGFLRLPASPVPGITPVSLELQSTKEVRVSKVRYPKPYRRNFAFKASRIPVAGAIYFPIRLKLRAGSTAQLGMHALRAKLTYQVVDDGGVSSPQEMAVDIPITIVDHHAQVGRDKNWPFGHVSAGDIVLMVILSPILLPMYPICAIFLDGCG
jgi:hypothetical protein